MVLELYNADNPKREGGCIYTAEYNTEDNCWIVYVPVALQNIKLVYHKDGDITKVMNPTPIDKKFEAFGWNVLTIDAHNFDEIEEAFGSDLSSLTAPKKEQTASAVCFLLTSSRCIL